MSKSLNSVQYDGVFMAVHICLWSVVILIQHSGLASDILTVQSNLAWERKKEDKREEETNSEKERKSGREEEKDKERRIVI